MDSQNSRPQRAYGVFVDQSPHPIRPAAYDHRGYPVVHATEVAAKTAIIRHALQRHLAFFDGSMSFEEAVSIDEYYVPVNVHPDGSVSTEAGLTFGRQNDSSPSALAPAVRRSA